MKMCARCKVEKPHSEFGASTRFRDGLRTWCRQCERTNALAWRNDHKEQALASLENWRSRNAEHIRNYSKTVYQARKEESKRKAIAWARNNRKLLTERAALYRARTREVLREKARIYAKQNPGIIRSNIRARKIGQKYATPAWANKFFMGEIYALSSMRTFLTGIPHHVDHIVPIRSKLVCGLHCEQNMRVVPAAYNLSKNNGYWPDMP